MTLSVLTSGGEGGFKAPGAADFWQPLFGTDGNFAITRSMIVMLLSVVVLGVFFVMSTKKLAIVPSRRQFLVEQIYSIPRNAVGRDMIGSKEFRKFLPLLFTLFTLILLNNLFGILPFVQFPTFSRVGFAFALTLVVYLTYLYIGMSRHGVGGFFKRMIPPGIPAPIVPVLFILELITYFVTRPLTLALRLFANMFAGHMLLLVFILGGEFMLLHGSNMFVRAGGFAGFGMGIVMTFFELLVQFLQAYVFTLLTAFYIADALEEHH